jgi:hypothetical protein
VVERTGEGAADKAGSAGDEDHELVIVLGLLAAAIMTAMKSPLPA